MHTLAMLIMLVTHSSHLVMNVRCCHESLSGPGAEESLYLAIVCLSSSLEKGAHIVMGLWSILLRISMLICQFLCCIKGAM